MIDAKILSPVTDDVPAGQFRTVPLRHPVRRLIELLLLFGTVVFAWRVLTNETMNWPIVTRYLTSDAVIKGLTITILLTVLAMLVAISVGLLLAVMRMSPSAIFRSGASFYIWVFRSVPALVQLIGWYNMASIFPSVTIGIPFTDLSWSADMNTLITPLIAATLGLGLNEGAYMAEIIRAGLQSVETGQVEAASALGMTPGRTLRRIVLPQAMRVILPPTGNETIGMLKFTSLASVVSLQELLGSVRGIYSQNFQVIPLLVVASLWYLLATSLLSLVQLVLERHFGRGSSVSNASSLKLDAFIFRRFVKGRDAENLEEASK